MNSKAQENRLTFPFEGPMEEISNSISTPFSTSAHELIIPEDYGPSDDGTLRSINWFQEHLNLSNGYVANVIRVRENRFASWKYERSKLSSSEIQNLNAFSSTLTHLLSYLNFRQDLIMNMLESDSEPYDHEPTPLTPPWLGTSLKNYIETQGANGIEKVDRWVQSLRWSDPF